MSSLEDKIQQLEETLLALECENHTLVQQVLHCQFEQYKLFEIQRLANAGTWELNHLTYDLTLSDELSRLLYKEDGQSNVMSWQSFLDLFVCQKGMEVRKTFDETVFKNGDGLDFEHHMIRLDGHIIFVRHHCKTFYNPIGQPLITVGLIHDYTDEHNLQVQLQKCSITDELTRLYNRRRINELLKEQHDIFNRFDTTSSYILVDIDNFKPINDTYGHQVGDEVLRKLTAFLKGMIRNIDSAGRWGGEEFLIICPQTRLKDAEHLAEKMRKGITKLKMPGDIQVTASFGVAEIQHDERIEMLLKRVDDALYLAKAQGRNKTVVSD